MNGPNTIKNKISRLENIQIPRYIPLCRFCCSTVIDVIFRDTIRKIMHENFEEGFQLRYTGRKGKRKRDGHLNGKAVFLELHCDGHEKLNFKALRLGHVGFDIYGMRCHASGFILKFWVVPNARCEFTVAHCYLDLLEEYKSMFLI